MGTRTPVVDEVSETGLALVPVCPPVRENIVATICSPIFKQWVAGPAWECPISCGIQCRVQCNICSINITDIKDQVVNAVQPVEREVVALDKTVLALQKDIADLKSIISSKMG